MNQPIILVEQLLLAGSFTIHPQGPDQPTEEMPVSQMLLGQGAPIDQQIDRVAAWIFWVGGKLADVERIHARSERRKSELFAELAEEAREGLTAAGGKVTEKAIEQAVRCHPDYLSICNAVLDMTHELSKMKVLYEAMKYRCDCLRTIAVNARKDSQVMV